MYLMVYQQSTKKFSLGSKLIKVMAFSGIKLTQV